ncbi:ribosomal-protein-alanine acetyltransferase [Alphaproteobacteria bacterium]|nr:ribosomal-protein-alanine acetyltransferase [Alphaproteobacteria bacterium]GHS97276.1 ribosomal-protein-alanine acetyltransferase [Alphaproteobacteria bacterium]
MISQNFQLLSLACNDAKDLATLSEEAFLTKTDPPWSEASFQTLLAKPTTFIGWKGVAPPQNILAGFLLVQNGGPEVEILKIAVAPCFQRQGLATRLLKHGLGNFPPDVTFWLEVQESNAPALRLYSSFGFRKQHERKNYYQSKGETQTAVVLVREPCHIRPPVKGAKRAKIL